ncbi:jg20697 [Pararge aegeria aegeria]|uniref:Jg20697 protein n=1 Tax=Pararge aegeria aegeria TaxID=348720 RepID=A0A8S4RPW7_9NEOP|nr:jg20697 [Pararge aegeria aegeria]
MDRARHVHTACSNKGNKNSIKQITQFLNSKELQNTLNQIIKIDQTIDYKEEMTDLKEKNKIKLRSKHVELSPYLDDIGLLRVGGRLQSSRLVGEIKNTIILSQTSHLSWLLVNDAHIKLLHGGYAMMMNYLRSRYWIVGLKQLVKKCGRQCVTCTRHKSLTTQPQMGNLPEVRVNPGPPQPFKCSGVDYAGPIQIRTSKGRGHRSYKGYICLFICMKTKAVHLEAVSDLTSSGFLSAFRRFTSRRGKCAEIWSDNGLNFVEAARELALMLNQTKSDFGREVAELLANDGTSWHFIPPRAPNFGGLWEAGIKSVKTHLA